MPGRIACLSRRPRQTALASREEVNNQQVPQHKPTCHKMFVSQERSLVSSLREACGA